MNKEPDNMWRVRNVSPEVRQRITQYAKAHDMSVGDALGFLVAPAGSKQADYGFIQSKQFSIAGDLRAAYNELRKRYKKKAPKLGDLIR